VKKTALLKELNVEEKLEIAKSRKTDIIEALIRQFELCAGSIGFLIEIRDIFSFLTNSLVPSKKLDEYGFLLLRCLVQDVQPLKDFWNAFDLTLFDVFS
jgi:hypothetical protein